MTEEEMELSFGRWVGRGFLAFEGGGLGRGGRNGKREGSVEVMRDG